MTSTATSTMTSTATSTMTTTIILETSTFPSEYIAILVIAGFILIIAIPIAYTYYKVKKSERSVGSMTPRYTPHYSNPVYEAVHDIAEDYTMESISPEESARYMDVFEDDDRND